MDNQALVKDLLDLIMNDSENLERTLSMLTDDCVWVIEPGVTEYHGLKQLRAFIAISMSGRRHDTAHKIEVLNSFFDKENVCIEYTHSAQLTGKIAGTRGTLKPGAARYCMTYHIRDAKFDKVHEYINSPSIWLSFLSPIALKYLHWKAIRKLAKEANAETEKHSKENLNR
jgi:ketosteroid isomerase-like protein